MIPTLAVLVVVIRTLVEGVKDLVPGLFEQRPTAAKWLVYALSFVAVFYYQLDVLAAVGMQMPTAGIRWVANALVLAVATMGGHDILDAIAGKR